MILCLSVMGSAGFSICVMLIVCLGSLSCSGRKLTGGLRAGQVLGLLAFSVLVSLGFS